MTLSPSPTNASQKEYATRLMEAVVPDVNMISEEEDAPIKSLTAARAAS